MFEFHLCTCIAACSCTCGHVSIRTTLQGCLLNQSGDRQKAAIRLPFSRGNATGCWITKIQRSRNASTYAVTCTCTCATTCAPTFAATCACTSSACYQPVSWERQRPHIMLRRANRQPRALPACQRRCIPVHAERHALESLPHGTRVLCSMLVSSVSAVLSASYDVAFRCLHDVAFWCVTGSAYESS